MSKIWLIHCLVSAFVFLPAIANHGQEERHKPPHRPNGNVLSKIVDKGFEVATKLNDEEIFGMLQKEPVTPMSRMGFGFRRPTSSMLKKFRCYSRGFLEASSLLIESLKFNSSEACTNLANLRVPSHKCSKRTGGKFCSSFTSNNRTICDRESRRYRNIDGTCNNLRHRTWGSEGIPMRRFLCPEYEGTDDPRKFSVSGSELPTARLVSVAMHNIPRPALAENISQMIFLFGQFVDHDMVFAPESPGFEEEGENMEAQPCCGEGLFPEKSPFENCIPQNVTGDPLYDAAGVECTPFVRSMAADMGCTFHQREQINAPTAYIDASNVYGSTDEVASSLRTMQDGDLKQTDPIETGGCPVPARGPFLPITEEGAFFAGDHRVNENSLLSSMHTIWLRVHHTIVQNLQKEHPDWDDEKLYQETRRIVYSLMQKIIYGEFLPVVLGTDAMKEYRLSLSSRHSYRRFVDASARNAFAAAAFRFGHSLVRGDLILEGGNIPLEDNFENTTNLLECGSSPSDFFRGITSNNAEKADSFIIDALTNQLFSEPAEEGEVRFGFDLVLLNLMRGRDHGIPPYNKWREFCGLQKFTSFENLRRSGEFLPTVVDNFEEIYDSIDDLDLFAGGMSEFQSGNQTRFGILGPTFRCIIGEQFQRLREGDRFFFQNRMRGRHYPMTDDQIKAIEDVTFAEILCKLTSVGRISPDVFKSTNFDGNAPVSCKSILANSAFPVGLANKF